MYPEESIQGITDHRQWWEEDDGKTSCRGRLCHAFVPYVFQTPLTLTPVGRPNPTEHHEVDAKIEQIRIGQRNRLRMLPVAALPLAGEKELYTVYKAKTRPCLILGDSWCDLPAEMCQKGRPIFQKTSTVIVAPYFGVSQDGTRAGFPPEFVDRVRRGMYPQFFWDVLPHSKKESFLFFAHAQPIGKHHDSLDLTKFKLSASALTIIDEWLAWYFTGNMPIDGLLYDARELLLL